MKEVNRIGRKELLFELNGESMTIRQMYDRFSGPDSCNYNTFRSRCCRLISSVVTMKAVNGMLINGRMPMPKRKTSSDTPVFSTNLWRPPAHAIGK